MKDNKHTIFKKVLNLVTIIPEGKVTTYGIIAKKVGIKDARVVGWALHSNKNPVKIPCHRVVNQQGELARGYVFGGADVQKNLLESEGITFADINKINLNKHLFTFD